MQKILCPKKFRKHFHLTMNDHVSTIAQTNDFEIHCPQFICIFLTNTATVTLLFIFILSTIDYCNSL